MLRYRVPLGFLLAFWYLLIARPVMLSAMVSGAMLVALGCALRAWAAGYLLKGKRVAVGGPYAYVRNPLYVGSFLVGLGFCLALWQVPLPVAVELFWFVFVVGFLTLYRAKSLSEEQELIRSLGSAYGEYAAKVPAFFPSRGKVSSLGTQRFSRELFRRNREYQCLLGCAAVLVLLALRLHYGF
jgi:protein-S-isoprenylcysteine O-methyltransferase Ste14